LANAATQRLICPCCAQVFRHPSGLATHVKFAHAAYHARHYNDISPIPASTRTRYTWNQKSKVLDKYFDFLLDPSCLRPYIEATKWAFGAIWEKRRGHLSKWMTACGGVRLDIEKGRAAKKARRTGVCKAADHPDCEDELYIRFLFRRTALGCAPRIRTRARALTQSHDVAHACACTLQHPPTQPCARAHSNTHPHTHARVLTQATHHRYPTNHYWLQNEFKVILDEVQRTTVRAHTQPYPPARAPHASAQQRHLPPRPQTAPPGYDGRTYSKSWAVSFCVRYSITTQAKNNVKVCLRAFARFLTLCVCFVFF
jgi:hypothetical protein